MNFYRRLFCLLLCFIVLSCGFSVTANAEEVDVPDTYKIVHESYVRVNGSATKIQGFTFYPNDGAEDNMEVTTSSYTFNKLKSGSQYVNYYHLVYNDNAVILEGGKNYTVSLNNVYFSALIGTSTPFYVRTPTISKIQIVYMDESTYTLDVEPEVLRKDNEPTFNLKFECSPSKDVRKIVIGVETSISSRMGGATSDYTVPITAYHGEMLGDDRYQFALEVESEEAGLLKGVIEWLKGIKNGITGLGDGIKNVFNSILELPSKIWGLISDGLKSLFVPDEEFIIGFKSDMDELLADKFGALYQVVDLTFDSWDSIMVSDEKNTIDIPEVTIPLPDDNEFSFGGQTVLIVPEGFDFLANACKSVCGMVCVYLFVNGLKKRYDEIMEK